MGFARYNVNMPDGGWWCSLSTSLSYTHKPAFISAGNKLLCRNWEIIK